MNSPLVSVIIPCYNSAAFLEKAVNSILNQTFTNIEVWIINDASTDNTLEIINRFKDQRIFIEDFKLNTKKVGAVNEVLKKVNGDFIAFQDSDDWSEPERLKLQVNAFEANPALGICFTNYRFCGDLNYDARNIALTYEQLREEFLNYKPIRETSNSPTNCPGMMISRKALKVTGGYHPYFTGRIGEDAHWIYRILKSFPGITLEKILYNYTVREGSLMTNSSQNVKAAYSLYILQNIINKDINENIDVLATENYAMLKDVELMACEAALLDAKKQYINLKLSYQNSMAYRSGKVLLSPFLFIKRLIRK